MSRVWAVFRSRSSRLPIAIGKAKEIKTINLAFRSTKENKQNVYSIIGFYRVCK